MSDHKIPPIDYHVAHIALVVVAWRFRIEQVARHGVMAGGGERIPDNAAELAGD